MFFGFFNRKKAPKRNVNTEYTTTMESPAWYAEPAAYTHLVELAESMISTCAINTDTSNEGIFRQGYRLFGLGESPSWIIFVAELLTRGSEARDESKPNPKIEFGNIAFSGSFLARESDTPAAHVKFQTTTNMPTEEEVRKYRKYLKRIKMDPETIIQRRQNEGVKTIITDYTNTGKGFASFIYILCDWAQEDSKVDQLKKALRLINLNISSTAIKGLSLPAPLGDLSFDTLLIQQRENEFGGNLIQKLANNDAAGCRRVPHYSHEKWNEDPIPHDNEKIPEIEHNLVSIVARRLLTQRSVAHNKI